VRSIIGEALLKRKRNPAFFRFPTGNDYQLLQASIRGLLGLYDASVRRMAA
jgi:hypothetical protein